LGYKEIAVLYINNEWGVGLKDVFEKEFENLGGKILISEGFEQDAKDFRTQLIKIKAKNPKVIFIPVYYIEAGLILKQAKELGIKAQFLSGDSIEKPEFIEIAGELAEGIIFGAPTYDPESKESLIKNFVDKYQSKFGKKPTVVAAHAYDATNIIALTLEKCEENATCIKDELYKIKDFPGVSGKTSFDKNGDAIKEILLKTVKNGQFVLYEE
jgi:branched-chain amino acid transport system substrate-binding protein